MVQTQTQPEDRQKLTEAKKRALTETHREKKVQRENRERGARESRERENRGRGGVREREHRDYSKRESENSKEKMERERRARLPTCRRKEGKKREGERERGREGEGETGGAERIHRSTEKERVQRLTYITVHVTGQAASANGTTHARAAGRDKERPYCGSMQREKTDGNRQKQREREDK